MALVWGGAACYNGHRVGDDFSAIGLIAQLGRKKINKAWTSSEEERLLKLALSGASMAEIAQQMQRTKSAVRTRALKLKIAIAREENPMQKGKRAAPRG